MTERITGCGSTDGEFINIQPVEYKRGHREYELVKRIAKLEEELKYALKSYAELLHNSVKTMNELEERLGIHK